MKLSQHIIQVFLILLTTVSVFGQTVEEQREKADKLFEKKQYVEATKEYVHLLSLLPRDHNLNFKYGACLLYNSNQKNKAFRYLNYAILNPDIDPQAFYYLGKAFHLNFQFEEAKRNYQIYKDKSAGKFDPEFNINRNIEMCKNGKRLLTTFTDIIVAEKQEISEKSFFRIYNDSKTVGGDILVTASFQSKLDKKMGHVPIVHYPPNAKKIFYSSYGDDMSTGKDIYVRRRLPDGKKWGDPQKLPGGVNTNEDEDFPYLHPSGRFLYFSSRGHNSMGGYDVFRSTFDKNTSIFLAPDNMDFAISSPDDDLFYVVDSLYQDAYFASARQSQDGKLHVYKVKVVRVPLQEIIVMGEYESEVSPENKSLYISFEAFTNKKNVGKTQSNKVGKYSFVFPKGGKYEYLIEIDGSDIEYKFVVDLPFLTEFRPLKQKIVHSMEDGNEVVRIYNLFDEDVVGAEAEALIAQVILSKSKLEVNIDNFDLKEIEVEQERDKILAELGFTNMSMREVADKLDELVNDSENVAETIERIESNMASEIIAKTERIETLDKIEKELLAKVKNESDPILKHKLITEAQQKAIEKNTLIETVKVLVELKEETIKTIAGGTSGNSDIKSLAEEFRTKLEEEDEQAAMKLLVSRKNEIGESVSAESVLQELIAENKVIREKIKAETKKENEYNQSIDRLENKLTILRNELSGANKRKADGIRSEIEEKEQELAIVKAERTKAKEKIISLNREISLVENKISSLQNAIETDFIASVDPQELEEAKNKVEEANSEEIDYETQLAELEAEYPEINGGQEDLSVYTELSEENDFQKNEILNNQELSEEKQLKLLKENNEASITSVDNRLEVLEKEIKDVEGSSEAEILQKEQEKLLDYKSELVVENNNYDERSNELANVDSIITPVIITENDILATYSDDVSEIKVDPELSEIEKLESLQSIDEELLKEIAKEEKSIEKKIKRTPEDENLIQQQKSLSELKEQAESNIAERTQTINALETNVEVAVNVEESFIEELRTIAMSTNSNALEAEYSSLEELKNQDDILAEYEKVLEEKINSNPNQTEKDKEELKWLTKESEVVASKRRRIKISIGELESSTVQTDKPFAKENEILSSYSEDIAKIEDNASISEVEKLEELQSLDEKLLKEIEKKEVKVIKQLNKSSSDKKLIQEAKELAQLKLNTQSNIDERSQLIESQITSSEETLAKEENDFKESLRETLLSENKTELNSEYSTTEELEKQDEILAAYEIQLDDKIVELLSKPNSTEQDKKELEWVKKEKAIVVEKRRRIKISFGELEHEVITRVEVDEDPTIASIDEENKTLIAQLENEDLSSTERKAITEEIKDNNSERVVRENEIIEESIVAEQNETKKLESELEKLSTDDSASIDKVERLIEKENEIIASIVEDSKKAKTEEEKNYILKKAQERQERLNEVSAEVLNEEKIDNIESSEGVTITSQEQLIKKKRRFSIQIGEITTEILRVEKEISKANKKEIPALKEELESLKEERSLLQSRLEQVDSQLSNHDETAPVVDVKALEEEITFNEERKLSATDEYKVYNELAVEALEVENQIAILESELKEKQNETVNLIAESSQENEETINSNVARIKEIEKEIDRLNVDLVQKKWNADQVLPNDEQEAMRIQNLVARGVKPIKLAAIVAAVIQMPADGFAIDANTESVYTESNPIPVDVESPSGLVYRVQIGAFAKPIPQNLFKEFTPVSGELIQGTAVTRYMAGFFNSSNDVVDARSKIRELGYSDAFVVAYCDGKRIGFGDARRREAAGTCVPKGKNEIMMEVAVKTAEKLGLPTSTEVQEVSENTYNEAPGAVEAEPIEEMKGLFFTVQIGVYNGPTAKVNLHEMTEVITIRLPNGQIRYSSGRFDSVKDALPRRSLALNNGVRGAFVTAYYKGERITLSAAKKLLAENGDSILQSTIEKDEEVIEPEVIPVVIRTDTVNIEVTEPVINEISPLRVQIVTKKQFDVYPRDVLNRYNAEGSFYFDEQDHRVKSVVYRNEDYLPRLYNFRDDIDTVYISEGPRADEELQIISVSFTDSIVPGDFIDWLLRFNYRKEYISTQEGLVLRIFGVEQLDTEVVLNDIRKFGLIPEVLEETEEELELEENQ